MPVRVGRIDMFGFDLSFFSWDLIRQYVLHGFFFSLQLTIVATLGGIFFGLAFGSILTMIGVPVLYAIFYRLPRKPS